MQSFLAFSLLVGFLTHSVLTLPFSKFEFPSLPSTLIRVCNEIPVLLRLPLKPVINGFVNDAVTTELMYELVCGRGWGCGCGWTAVTVSVPG